MALVGPQLLRDGARRGPLIGADLLRAAVQVSQHLAVPVVLNQVMATVLALFEGGEAGVRLCLVGQLCGSVEPHRLDL